MTYRPAVILAGGQTGADQGALAAARFLGIPTGGTAPKGWKTEDGPAPWLADYGLVESTFVAYSLRTAANVHGSDATVIFSNLNTPGSSLTLRLCEQEGKPCTHDPDPASLREWCETNNTRSLNVAGNRESVNPGIGERVRAVLIEAFGNSEAS